MRQQTQSNLGAQSPPQMVLCGVPSQGLWLAATGQRGVSLQQGHRAPDCNRCGVSRGALIAAALRCRACLSSTRRQVAMAFRLVPARPSFDRLRTNGPQAGRLRTNGPWTSLPTGVAIASCVRRSPPATLRAEAIDARKRRLPHRRSARPSILRLPQDRRALNMAAPVAPVA